VWGLHVRTAARVWTSWAATGVSARLDSAETTVSWTSTTAQRRRVISEATALTPSTVSPAPAFPDSPVTSGAARIL